MKFNKESRGHCVRIIFLKMFSISGKNNTGDVYKIIIKEVVDKQPPSTLRSRIPVPRAYEFPDTVVPARGSSGARL